MTPTLYQKTATSLLGTPAGELVLRVRGTGRDGQILRLNSSKCTFGAGSYCSLRLRAKGVRPLHCIVVRGAGSTIVRRWSPDTLLNGRDFDEAALEPGDLLSVGPIELEVMAIASVDEDRDGAYPDQFNGSASDDFSLEMSPPSDLQRLPEEGSHDDWHEERRTLRTQAHGRVHRLIQRLRDQSAEADGQQAGWQEQITELEAGRESERTSWDQQRDAWQAERELWDRQQSNWESERNRVREQQSCSEDELANDRERLSQQQEDLASELARLSRVQEELETERTKVDAAASDLREHVENVRQDQAAERANIDQLRDELENERVALLSEREELSTKHCETQRIGEERQADLDRREAAQAERQVELETRSEQFLEQAKKLEAEQAQDSTLPEEFARQQEALESRQAELKTQSARLAEKASELAGQEIKVTEQADKLARRADELETRSKQLVERAEKYDLEETDLEVRREEFANQQEAFSSQSAELKTQSEYLVERRSELAGRELKVAEQADELTRLAIELKLETQKAPTPTDEVAPVVRKPFDSEGSDESDSDESAGEELAGGKLAEKTSPSESEQVVADVVSDHDAETSGDNAVVSDGNSGDDNSDDGDIDDDDSINDYMQKLLARTRGVSQAESSPSESYDESDENWSHEANASLTEEGRHKANAAVASATDESDWIPTPMPPRRSAPEATTDIEALRDLANQSARSDIDTSLLQRWKMAATGKACLSLIFFVVGYLLLENATDELGNAYLGGAVAFVGSVYWAVQCGTLMRNASWLYTGENAGGYTTPMDENIDSDESSAPDGDANDGFELR